MICCCCSAGDVQNIDIENTVVLLKITVVYIVDLPNIGGDKTLCCEDRLVITRIPFKTTFKVLQDATL